jgi:spore germination cell wall hydrolase CwlJ-like protein
MRSRRVRPKRAHPAFGLTIAMYVLMPTPVGLQDIASLIARQSFVPDTMRQRLASPFGTIHAATFSMPRPIGTAIPHVPLRLVSLDPRDVDVTGSIDRKRYLGALDPEPKRVYPEVNRSSKGDRLVPATRGPADESPGAVPDETDAPGAGGALQVPPVYDISLSLELHPQIPVTGTPEADDDAPSQAAEAPAVDPQPIEPQAAEKHPVAEAPAQADGGTPSFVDNPTLASGQVFFGVQPLGGDATQIEPWAPGATPILISPEANDPDLKRPVARAPATAAQPGETIASKGEVTGEGKRPKTPAERLALAGKARVKAEKCLTDAVYFEARGEPERGQIAVAQVVMNRVFSGYYPDNVCGVVYQNAHRHLACQFTFACDGIPDRVTEPEAWAKAKQIASDTLDGKLWLKEVGKSTHYHAYWVRPRWVREMMKLHRLGVHTFYRPRAWGDGADAPVWGDAAKSQTDKKPEADKKTSANAGDKPAGEKL